MMIGGGGNGCSRADHGIGITEADYASFDDSNGAAEYDFGYNPDIGGDNSFSSQSYSLNLWIRWSTVILNTYLLLKARYSECLGGHRLKCFLDLNEHYLSLKNFVFLRLPLKIWWFSFWVRLGFVG